MVTKNFVYQPFCDDFGPMNMGDTLRFAILMEKHLSKCRSEACENLVFNVADGPRALTNASYLVGSYMVLKFDAPPEKIFSSFEALDQSLLEEYRDATHARPDFRLSLLDCWGGLRRGQACGWVALPKPASPDTWGAIDLDEYTYYDHPLNADMHEVVPGKFIAFRGPKNLGGRTYRDDTTRGTRTFSAEYYADIFLEIDVSTVIRLNEVEYDRRAFTDRGIAHHHLAAPPAASDQHAREPSPAKGGLSGCSVSGSAIQHHELYFEDCTAPPPRLVADFLRIAAAAPGRVAVHCKAGLGRTGTLIAAYIMKHHGFSAREAMGWLRIMRPGSVIGEQVLATPSWPAPSLYISARSSLKISVVFFGLHIFLYSMSSPCACRTYACFAWRSDCSMHRFLPGLP